jgi:hypothetical protein
VSFSKKGHRKQHFGAFDSTHVKQITSSIQQKCTPNRNHTTIELYYQTNEVNLLKKPQEKLNSTKKATNGSTQLLKNRYSALLEDES